MGGAKSKLLGSIHRTGAAPPIEAAAPPVRDGASANTNDRQASSGGLAFPLIISDPEARDDSRSFPLDGQDLCQVSDEQLASLLDSSPLLYDCRDVRIVRISASLVLKGGAAVSDGEPGNMKLAVELLNLPVPRVHRAFSRPMMTTAGAWPSAADSQQGYFMVMDYVRGPTVKECWASLAPETRESVASQVASMIETMQSTPLEGLPAGPIGRSRNRPFEGPWFSLNGAGPFATAREIEDWCNHKIDVCIRFSQLPADAPRFKFDDTLVLTHQDIGLQNLILDPDGKVWLIDWEWAGAYPRGFEQAALASQSRNPEFSDMVLARLSDPQLLLREQRAMIAYGLTTAAPL